MNIDSTLKEYTEQFRRNGFESPDLEAAYILSEATGIKHYELPLHASQELTDATQKKAEEFLKRRLSHEPFQYIFGWTPFRYIDLKVGPGVLIPRPETEMLVDIVLKHLKPASTVCELGIGSGAISLALASERPDIRVFGSEKSDDAFRWAELNRKESGLRNVTFVKGDLFSGFPGMKFDAVVANLPYIPESALPDLSENVRNHEPHSALFADDNGFAVLKRAIQESPAYLKYCGAIFFEIGEDQGERAADAAAETNAFKRISIEKDMFGNDRFLIAFVENGDC